MYCATVQGSGLCMHFTFTIEKVHVAIYLAYQLRSLLLESRSDRDTVQEQCSNLQQRLQGDKETIAYYDTRLSYQMAHCRLNLYNNKEF